MQSTDHTGMNPLDLWLRQLVDRGASDLFLVVGLPPAVRINGKIQQLAEPALTAANIENAVVPAISKTGAEKFLAGGHTDTSLRRDGLGRFRINLHRERG